MIDWLVMGEIDYDVRAFFYIEGNMVQKKQRLICLEMQNLERAWDNDLMCSAPENLLHSPRN